MIHAVILRAPGTEWRICSAHRILFAVIEISTTEHLTLYSAHSFILVRKLKPNARQMCGLPETEIYRVVNCLEPERVNSCFK